MKPGHLVLGLLAFALGGACEGRAQSIGQSLPRFTPGGLDIHHINTGEGSAAFLVLPDRTTTLIDCGFGQDLVRPPRYKAPRKPDDSRLPGEWVARYIQKVHPLGATATVDYGVISHFHGDHMGGIPELLRHIHIARLLDRGWPDYRAPLAFAGPLAPRYRAALKEQMDRHGMQVERFIAGAADQIRLRHAPDEFPKFEVRNLSVNGEVWTGSGTEVRQRLDPAEKPNENARSAALRVRYGRFDYFTGGDTPGSATESDAPASRDVESPLAWVTGPVDVAVLDHHGNSDGSTPYFLSVLQPRVCIAQVWAARHLDPTTFARLGSEQIYRGPRDIFTTNGMWPGRAEHIVKTFGEDVGRRHLENLKTLSADQGHVVIRVAPGGARYHVIVLTDADESLHISSVHGPYDSR